MVAASLVLALAACRRFIDKQAADSTFRILEKSQIAAARLSDLELARAAMPGGLVQLQAFALAYPEHRGFRELYADSLCQYALAFVFDDWEDADLLGRTDEAARLNTRLRGLTRACVDANLALLPEAWREAREKGGDAWSARVAAATRDEVPQLLWITTVDAVTLALDPMRNIGKLASIVRGLERCVELRPGFRDSDAELLLGTLEAGRSQFLGGADGSEWFARARKQCDEGALIVDVMFARGTLVARRDRAAFKATLEKVLAADVTRWPERRLSNELARHKAERYLAAIDRLIPPQAPQP